MGTHPRESRGPLGSSQGGSAITTRSPDVDPVLYEGDGAIPEEADLPFELDEESEIDEEGPLAMTLAFVLIERLTGLRITEEWFYEGLRPAHLTRQDQTGSE